MSARAILPIPEKQLEKTCTDLLELDGWRALKTDPVSRREWGKGFGEVGMADHLYIRYGFPVLRRAFHGHTAELQSGAQVMWIEWKRERGGPDKKSGLFTKAEKAKIHQLAWIAAERARGALVLLCGVDFPPTIDGFIKWYRESGLCRRVG